MTAFIFVGCHFSAVHMGLQRGCQRGGNILRGFGCNATLRPVLPAQRLRPQPAVRRSLQRRPRFGRRLSPHPVQRRQTPGSTPAPSCFFSASTSGSCTWLVRSANASICCCRLPAARRHLQSGYGVPFSRRPAAVRRCSAAVCHPPAAVCRCPGFLHRPAGSARRSAPAARR